MDTQCITTTKRTWFCYTWRLSFVGPSWKVQYNFCVLQEIPQKGEILSHDEDDASGSMHKIEQQSLYNVKAENCEQYPLQLLRNHHQLAILVPWFWNTDTKVAFFIIVFEVMIWATKASLSLLPSLLPFATSGWMNTEKIRFLGGTPIIMS